MSHIPERFPPKIAPQEVPGTGARGSIDFGSDVPAPMMSSTPRPAGEPTQSDIQKLHRDLSDLQVTKRPVFTPLLTVSTIAAIIATAVTGALAIAVAWPVFLALAVIGLGIMAYRAISNYLDEQKILSLLKEAQKTTGTALEDLNTIESHLASDMRRGIQEKEEVLDNLAHLIETELEQLQKIKDDHESCIEMGIPPSSETGEHVKELESMLEQAGKALQMAQDIQGPGKNRLINLKMAEKALKNINDRMQKKVDEIQARQIENTPKEFSLLEAELVSI